MFDQTFSSRRVLVTGHTGFKGSWLCEWLLSLGAHVRGYALEPPTDPNLFEQLGLSARMDDVRADVRNRQNVRAEIEAFEPEFLFHLAAQPLVRYSYENPIETYETNVMGTIHVLDALKAVNRPCVAIMVTTDKCYENHEWHFGYRETDAMGGADPYSSSKGMAELAVSAYRRSWFHDGRIRIASVRAGNVIGGGDWAKDRIVPDCIRSLSQNEPIPIRNRHARRPWQHVLDPLNGYLHLAMMLRTAQTDTELHDYCSAFNFGPPTKSNQTVGDLVQEVLKNWPGTTLDRTDPDAVHEATMLNLCTDKAHAVLGWSSRWDFSTSLKTTVDWYRRVRDNESPVDVTSEQIRQFASN